MSFKIGKKDVIWSYLAYIFKYGTSMFLLPLILKCLSSKELGIWYVFNTIGAFVLLFDLGFSPTIMRNFSYAWSGAEKINKKGYCKSNSNEPNYNLLFKIIKTSKFIYLIISISALIVTSLVGSLYIRSIIDSSLNYHEVMTAWGIYCLGVFFNLYYSYWNPLLIGIGKIKEYQKAVVCSQMAFILISLIGFRLNFGLVAISTAYLSNGLLLRLICKYYYNKINIGFKYNKVSFKDIIYNTKIMWHNAYRSGLVSMGVYLESNINTIIASKFLGLTQTASYGLVLQIFLVVRIFSSTSIKTFLPLFNSMRVNNEREKLRNTFATAVFISWASFIFSVIFIGIFGKYFLGMLKKTELVLDPLFLIIMSIQSFLVFNHGDVFSPLITTKNEIPFTVPTLITGVCTSALAFISVKYLKMGIWGLLITSILVQACYNNWKWPKVVMKDLDISIMFIIKNGFNNIIKKILKFPANKSMHHY